ncbi:glycosyltransferase [Glaesserella sp.]|uniref:glycosyltransferase n=1 Tax=Glaesserella sp. TaxID=2094731 RepID=UPI0035A118F3
MHILFLPSWYPLNAGDLNGSFFREQAKALAKAGMTVGIVVPQLRSITLGKKAILGSYQTEVWEDGNIIAYMKHGVRWFPRIPYIDMNMWVKEGLVAFEKYIQEQGKPDVIHVHSIVSAGPLALKIYKKYKIPFCITEHSTVFGRNLVESWKWKILEESARFAKAKIAVSASLADTLKQKLTHDDWDVIPNLLDEFFVSNYQVKDKKNQICAVGFLHEKKGFDILISAFALIHQDYPNLKLCIGGDGAQRQRLMQLIEQLNLQEKVMLLGRLSRSEVCYLMQESLFYVVSSHIETFGVVAIEALSQGLPVVSTRCGGTESILVEGDGIFVDVNSVEALAKGMIELLEKYDDYDVESIRRRCVERFAEKAFVEKMERVYRNCINENK